ncbi:MAG: hypothetical protein L0H64_04155, partial [Pseudonocardia sp.]|nr:hypothetical protein [Pseudonocardia sp.]
MRDGSSGHGGFDEGPTQVLPRVPAQAWPAARRLGPGSSPPHWSRPLPASRRQGPVRRLGMPPVAPSRITRLAERVP